MSARILLFDLETSPLTVHTWGLRDQNIGLSQIRQHPRVIGMGAKWLGARSVMWKSEYHHSRSEMLEWAAGLLDDADIAVHFNGNSFDVPWLHGEFAREEIARPSPFKNVDLYRVVRKSFRFPSYKLQYVSKALGLEGKVDTGGHELWVQCLESEGEEQRRAWAKMRRYAKQDVALLEPLFYKLQAYFPATVNLGVYEDGDELRCQKCGKTEHLQSRGLAATAQRLYQQYHCYPGTGGCGGWSRDTRSLGGAKATGVV